MHFPVAGTKCPGGACRTVSGMDLIRINMIGRLSSAVELRFCKPSVLGSNPRAGSNFELKSPCFTFFDTL